MIYGIEGQFGSGKTNLMVYLSVKNSGCKVISNIKMEKNLLPNYYYFEDEDLIKVLRSANLYNDLEREVYSKIEEGRTIPTHQRKKYTKIIIAFDEAGAIANNRLYKAFDDTATEYINQNRKNIQDIYLITADGDQTDKSLRRHVESYMTVQQLYPFWFLKNIGVVKRYEKDGEGNIKMLPYLAKDEKGDYVTKFKPSIRTISVFWRPSVWNKYDDLHKNIKDPYKYTKADLTLVSNLIKGDKLLIPIFEKTKPLILEMKNKQQQEEAEANERSMRRRSAPKLT